ncbi:MAG: CHAT domain-containing protein [Acidimicrobiia bacterium]
MSASQYRSQLERKRKQRVDTDEKAGQYRSKESRKRADADKARQAAAKTSSETTATSKLREAERRDKEAAAAGTEASRWQGKASRYATEEANLAAKLTQAERSDADAVERKRRRDQQQADRKAAADRAALEYRISHAESAVDRAVRELRAPKIEKLRVLVLGASSEGDLRVGREQKRIRAAVESALHRDLIELDVRPAATTADLLDGITKFRPHVVHFSGHSSEDLIVFEDERDERHEGVIVTAEAFAAAIRATDAPPLLVLLNACRSAGQIDNLVAQVVPFAIGMANEIEDGDAINYAASSTHRSPMVSPSTPRTSQGRPPSNLQGLTARIYRPSLGPMMSTPSRRSLSNPSGSACTTRRSCDCCKAESGDLFDARRADMLCQGREM